jgi:DNA-binding response OmpR family regulator
MLSNMLFSVDRQCGALPAAPDVHNARPADAEALLGRDPGTTVVVVEDDEALRDVLCHRLRAAGYEVLAAASAVDAHPLLTKCKSKRLVLITDLVLNGEGGWSLATWARGRFPNLPIIFMSGCIDESVVHSALEHGNTTFLQKPFSLQRLIASLESLSKA